MQAGGLNGSISQVANQQTDLELDDIGSTLISG
jgi:hypothetical protein